MFTRTHRRQACLTTLFLALFTAISAAADHLAITRAFSGIWDQPDHESQGLVLQIATNAEGEPMGVAYWFTFAEDLDSAWYMAIGPVDGHLLDMQLYRATGTGFLEPEVPENVPVEAVGTLLLDFHNCNQGTAHFDTEDPLLGSGEFRIRRLASIYNMRCSGGISDDTPGDARPKKYSVRLQPARDDVSGSGIAMFWERADRSDFKVGVKGVPDGEYELFVCGESRGSFETELGEGGLEFRSPESDAKPLLDFDPRDCLIELNDDQGVALTTGDAVLALGPPGPAPSDPDEEDDEISVKLDNTGEFPEAAGNAELEIETESTRFTVQVRNLPVGSYTLRVGGVEEGVIEVEEQGAITRGRLSFSDPQTGDDLELDFDPRGQVVEVLDGTTVVLDALFPDS